VAAYLNRIRLFSLCAFAYICIYVLVANVRGREAQAGLLFALPNLLLTFVPASRISIARGIAMSQGLLFVAVLGMILFLALVTAHAPAFNVDALKVAPLFLSQLLLLLSAAKRAPSEGQQSSYDGSALFSATFNVIYLAYIFAFVLR
jgi:hypothetical protein